MTTTTHDDDDDEDDSATPLDSKNKTASQSLPTLVEMESLSDNDSKDWQDDDYYWDAPQAAAALLLEKTKKFTLPTDPNQFYRATKLNICSFARPHMRAFHASWMCFCVSWFLWFSIVPLLPIISHSIKGMTKEVLWTSNMVAMVGTIFLRILLGPLCDQYGGRRILTVLLGVCAIPCATAGWLIHDVNSLLIIRALVGCVGGTLVPAQFWIASHFTPACAGVAMATAAGWGAMGGGLAQVIMGSVVYPTVLDWMGGDQDMAWRVSLLVPAIAAMLMAFVFYFCTDDCPLGNYDQVKKAGLLQERSAVDSFRAGVFNLNAWILFFQFGASIGIELTVESGLAMHLTDRFDLDSSRACAIASLFGLMNIFSRGFGGWLSDLSHQWYSLRGRLALQMLFLLLEAVFILGFCNGTTLSNTIPWMILFAAAGQISMGTCFGIVPYVEPKSTGTIAGIVGAGGNVGAVLLVNVFRTLDNDIVSFRIMAVFCFLVAWLTPFIVISGYRGLVFGAEQQRKSPQTLSVPIAVISENTSLLRHHAV